MYSRINVVLPIPASYQGRRLTDADLDAIGQEYLSGIDTAGVDVGAVVGNRTAVTIPLYTPAEWTLANGCAQRPAIRVRRELLARR